MFADTIGSEIAILTVSIEELMVLGLSDLGQLTQFLGDDDKAATIATVCKWMVLQHGSAAWIPAGTIALFTSLNGDGVLTYYPFLQPTELWPEKSMDVLMGFTKKYYAERKAQKPWCGLYVAIEKYFLHGSIVVAAAIGGSGAKEAIKGEAAEEAAEEEEEAEEDGPEAK
jgi:hypothetical protein